MSRVNTRTATDSQVNATATATIAAPGPGFRWYITRILASVSGGASGVTVLAGATVVWQGVATPGGPLSEVFDPPLDVPANVAVSCVATAAGVGNGCQANIQAFLGS